MQSSRIIGTDLDSNASFNMEKLSSRTTASHQPRTLQVHFDNWTWRKATIYDRNDKLELYRVECHIRKPHIVLRSSSSEEKSDSAPSLGEASVHCLSSRISINLQSERFELSSCGAFKNGYTYKSPSIGSVTRTWRSKNKLGYFDLLLVDEAATPIARISLSMWRLHKVAKFEIMHENIAQGGKALDEVLLTGLAVMQKRLTMYCATLGASTASGAVVA